MGMWTALPQQAYATYPRYSYSSHYQPRYTGPLASSVPAGVNGQVIPVSDTYEVTAARNAFFDAYQKQLAAVGAIGSYNPAVGAIGSYNPAVGAIGSYNPLYQQTPYGGIPSPGQAIYNPGQTTYNPGQTIYNPGQSIYTSGQTIYNPGQAIYSPGQAYTTTPFYAQTIPATVVVANGHVQDTPEVAAAKAQFFALYNQQAALAAAAPDVYNH
ncbi:cuticle protein CP1876-like [Palaemon carinicauda]|uniref:cuticle protein CP1876-like n=1 Tax=Palaemon carinicauda TaxID=392227 RepID=UPI0035B66D05